VEKVLGFLRLARPANIVTAIADILAGVAVSGLAGVGLFGEGTVFWLILATIGLYGGGVVMNDVFDADLDAVERPERPIPSGLVSKREATFWGLALLVGGITAAALASFVSALIAQLIAIAALVYDRWGKHHVVLGPVNMGICRGLNLLLGMSAVPAVMTDWWFLALVPIVYIGAVTMISRGEVHGGSRDTGVIAGVLYVIAIGSVLTVAYQNGKALPALFFVALWGVMIFLPLLRAIRSPVGKNIGRAVRAGVLALILMNAAWAAAFGSFVLALVILALLPLSLVLARAFAVT
jgi:4-hydroxybenzoate polyprenyltransferase